MGNRNYIGYIKIIILNFLIPVCLYYNDEATFDNFMNKKLRIVDEVDLTSKRLLAIKETETNSHKGGFERDVSSHDIPSNFTDSDETKSTEKRLKKGSGKNSKIIKKFKKMKLTIFNFLKKLEKRYEKIVYSHFCFIDTLMKDPMVNKIMFTKILLKKYRLFLVMPFVKKILEFILYLMRITNLLALYPFLGTIVTTIKIVYI
ncbi:Plasmodium exported protein, unknown function [Plasmodium vivax]|uniref:Uncharacterized protein n=1 Tax=Plasmodium vivax TaxID=5855 RepID=A0A565A1D9_PLAVI|nr:Plasmodium exported protein, unknown function [Plasmodium vivax]